MYELSWIELVQAIHADDKWNSKHVHKDIIKYCAITPTAHSQHNAYVCHIKLEPNAHSQAFKGNHCLKSSRSRTPVNGVLPDMLPLNSPENST
jgi:hypothetical protein